MKPEDGETRLSLCRDWYNEVRGTYESLTKIVVGTIEGLLKEKKIDYLTVTGRAKTLDSLLGKIQRKNYRDPRADIHDLTGVRVITYIESDVDKAVELLRSAFTVHPDKSLDKTTELGVDRIGYRSVHLVCDLGKQRERLLEYAPYKGMIFEIQIRTVLQHAWAEIEHDRNYKFAGVLPAQIERRFHLAAGTLEMVDHEFDSLAKAIDAHSKMVAHETKKGNLDIPVDTPSLQELMRARFGGENWIRLGRLKASTIVNELKRFGCLTLSDVDKLLEPSVVSYSKEKESDVTDIGLLRSAMMYSDVDRYFKSAWRHAWQVLDVSSFNFLESKYPTKKLNALMQKHDISVLPDSNFQIACKGVSKKMIIPSA